MTEREQPDPARAAEQWEIVVEIDDAAALPALEAAMEAVSDTVAVFETGPTRWRLTGWTESEPDAAALSRRFAAAAAEHGLAPPVPEVRPVEPKDWVAEVERTLRPITVGPWYIYGSHVTEPPPAGTTPVRLDAGMAFGTGGHETTRGCLTAVGRCFERARPRAILDVGTGSGILAIAIARHYEAPVLASDNDPVAVAVARENAAINGVADLVDVVESEGFAGPMLRARAPYDLIVANIVANPLCALAPDMAAHADSGARAVLSGILAEQAAAVRRAYDSAGFGFVEAIAENEWRTLILERRA